MELRGNPIHRLVRLEDAEELCTESEVAEAKMVREGTPQVIENLQGNYRDVLKDIAIANKHKIIGYSFQEKPIKILKIGFYVPNQ
ncbi:hypothetical protein J4474_00280 [Candidatus Pacearchaeota archaeon]|nr:hypothetical protein [Candidatus Pacearchaeota archaeon]